MFITHRLIVDAGYAAARARLAQFVDTGGMAIVAQDSYQGVITRVIRVGPAGEVPGASKLVKVRFVGPVERGGATTIWLHWEATGAASGLFPALDADLTLMAKGQEQSQLRLDGYYRPPLGRLGAGLDRAIMHRVASATVRALLHSAADALAEPGQGPIRHQEGTGHIPAVPVR
jgi:hypothetical protein